MSQTNSPSSDKHILLEAIERTTIARLCDNQIQALMASGGQHTIDVEEIHRLRTISEKMIAKK